MGQMPICIECISGYEYIYSTMRHSICSGIISVAQQLTKLQNDKYKISYIFSEKFSYKGTMLHYHAGTHSFVSLA